MSQDIVTITDPYTGKTQEFDVPEGETVPQFIVRKYAELGLAAGDCPDDPADALEQLLHRLENIAESFRAKSDRIVRQAGIPDPYTEIATTLRHQVSDYVTKHGSPTMKMAAKEGRFK